MDKETARGQGPTPDPAAGQQAQVATRSASGHGVSESVAASRCAGCAPAARAQAVAAAWCERPATAERRIARRCAAQSAALRAARSVRELAGWRRIRPGNPVRHQGRGVRSVDSPLRRAGQAELVDPVCGDDDRRGTSSSPSTCTRTARSPICRWSVRLRSARSTARRTVRSRRRIRRQPLPPEYPSEKAFFTVTFFYNEEPQ